MSEQVDLLGHAMVQPRLNVAEYDYLTAFAQSARNGSQDRYAVPGNPAAIVRSSSETGGDPRNGGGASNDPGRRQVRRPGRQGERQPSSWCPWVPAAGGRVLAPHQLGQGRAAAAWLRYLIRHFLARGGCAASATDPRFASFTFDHILNGVFVARWRQSGRMCVIRVRSNQVRQQILTVGDPDAELWGSLPIEDELDRIRLTRSGRRRISTASDLVYPAVERAR